MSTTIKTAGFVALLLAFFLSAAPLAFADAPVVSPSVVALTPFVIGDTTDIGVSFPAVSAGRAQLFVASKASGTSTVTVMGTSVTLPMDEAVSVGWTALKGGAGLVSFAVPNNPALEGRQLYFIAVTITNGQATLTAMMPSGPIIIDEIA